MLIPEDIYRLVKQAMPIPCVDLIVIDKLGRALLVKRANYPALGEWWFPGGRVHFLETRHGAVKRKLAEECNLDAVAITELGSFDLIFPVTELEPAIHGITTLFLVRVAHTTNLKLDDQSNAADWRPPQAWLDEKLHPFVATALTNNPAKAL
jgi:ADP-ribose pyrophosphatase YjhB (NUDIX family)